MNVRRARWTACAGLSLLIGASLPAPAAEHGRPAAVTALEDSFNGFFLLTTTGDGTYDIFQRVEDEIGIPPDSNVVCLFHQTCYLEIARMPPSTVAEYSGRESPIGRLRQRAGAVRDSYAALRMTAPDKRPTAVEAWRDAIGRLGTCLRDATQC